jgi:hypothetical protein
MFLLEWREFSSATCFAVNNPDEGSVSMFLYSTSQSRAKTSEHILNRRLGWRRRRTADWFSPFTTAVDGVYVTGTFGTTDARRLAWRARSYSRAVASGQLVHAWWGPTHFTRTAHHYLNIHLPGNWIGRNGPVAWPLLPRVSITSISKFWATLKMMFTPHTLPILTRYENAS